MTPLKPPCRGARQKGAFWGHRRAVAREAVVSFRQACKIFARRTAREGGVMAGTPTAGEFGYWRAAPMRLLSD
jgi:hypothetical protein